MTIIDVMYIAVAAAVAAVSVRNPRGILWVACLAASYFISGLWWRSGYTNGALVTFMCDTAVFLAIYSAGRKRWELWLLGVQFCMVMTSLVYAIMPGIEHEVYSIILEALNAVALILIGRNGAYALAGYTNGGAFDHVRNFLGFGFAAGREGNQAK